MPTDQQPYMLDLSKIWDLVKKVFFSPTFLTAFVPIILSLFTKFFPGVSPEIITGIIGVLVEIIPRLFAVEMSARAFGWYAWPAVERAVQTRAGWTPDASGKMQAPAPRAAA